MPNFSRRSVCENNGKRGERKEERGKRRENIKEGREGQRRKKNGNLISEIPVLWRCLADSNRRRRFCRPLTKPLIQGTE